MIGGEATQYELKSIFLPKKWVDKVIDTNKISDKMIVIKALVQGIIMSVVSVYTSHRGLGDSQKDHFCDILINNVRKSGEKNNVVIAGTSIRW